MSLSLLDEILLRIVVDPVLTAKGDDLTWPELDGNFIIIHNAIRELATVSDENGFEPYDAGTTYTSSPPSFVSYQGNIYQFISPINQSGVTPGSDPLVWELVSMGLFAHQQNTDQYLDYGGANQISAEDLYALSLLNFALANGTDTQYIRGDGVYEEFPTIPDSGDFWALGGNDLSGLSPAGDYEFGTISNNGIPVITNELLRFTIENTGDLAFETGVKLKNADEPNNWLFLHETVVSLNFDNGLDSAGIELTALGIVLNATQVVTSMVDFQFDGAGSRLIFGATVEGAYSIVRSGDNLNVERYESSVWVMKGQFTPT